MYFLCFHSFLNFSPFVLFHPASPDSLRPSPHSCQCLWVRHVCSLAGPLTFLHQYSYISKSVTYLKPTLPRNEWCINVYIEYLLYLICNSPLLFPFDGYSMGYGKQDFHESFRYFNSIVPYFGGIFEYFKFIIHK